MIDFLAFQFNYYVFFFFTVSMLFVILTSLFIFKHNLIVILLLVELIFLAAIINCVVGSVYFRDINGQLFALVILTISAAELAIILSMIVLQYRSECDE